MSVRDLLQWLGLGPDPVQPDVSGHTIPNLIRQTGGQENGLRLALGSLYEDVKVLSSDAEGVSFDLSRGSQQMAALHYVHMRPGLRCRFIYWDQEERVNAFLGQAAQWAEAELGLLEQARNEHGERVWRAQKCVWQIELSRPSTGSEAEAQLVLTSTGE